MAWSYTKKAEDQLYADDEHGPIIFDPGATLGVPGSGNVISVGSPISGQLATWTDATHIAGTTILAAASHPAHTGDVTCISGSTVLAYSNPVPASKAGLPAGGSTGQVLAKNSGTNYDTIWVPGGGNVVIVPTPTVGQLAIWTDGTHIQGVTVLPAANFPTITGDIVITGGAFVSTYNNVVPPAKAGLPIGGATGQVLQKNTATNFDASWVNPPVTGGNVSNSGAPQGGQIATWVDATHVTGVNTVPVANAGVPPGGALNQVLTKNSSTNFDASWLTPPVGGGGGGSSVGEGGVMPLVLGQGYIDVTFSTAQPDANWVLAGSDIVNSVDATPLNVTKGVITSKTTTGFRQQLIGLPDTSNYKLVWSLGIVQSGVLTQNPQNVSYTLVLTDSGKHIFHDSATAHTYTIPANASVAFPIGTAITVVNNTGAGALTLAITTDTLRRGDGTAGTGNRTITADSVVTILKTKSTEWMITGKFS